MKRPLILVPSAIAAGLCLGLVFTHGITAPGSAPSTTNQQLVTAAPLTSAAVTSPILSNDALLPSPEPVEPLDLSDDSLLLNTGDLVIQALKDHDYRALASMVHSVKGLTFTPYSTVNFDCNRCFTAREISNMDHDSTVYTWGVQDSTGLPIKLTFQQYIDRFVFNTDYTKAPIVSTDQIRQTGNALENVEVAYPDCRFVEYHFPGLDQSKNGYDWCSLKLVFIPDNEHWALLGIIHSEWTA